MNATTLRAHFDGRQIVLDEPFDLALDTKLIVTVVPNDLVDTEREDWMRLSQEALARAYCDDEPEYTLDMIKVWNPEYEGIPYTGGNRK